MRAWGVLHLEHLEVSGVRLSFGVGEGGEFNVNGLTRALAQATVNRARGNAPSPNMLFVHFGALRGLVGLKPGARPRVELRARGASVSTGEGSLMAHEDGQAARYAFDETLALPVSDPSTVVSVCVLSGARLLGR